MAEPNIILLGSGGHASVLYDMMRLMDMAPTAIVDSGRERGPVSDFYNLHCIGDDEALLVRNPADVILVNGVGSSSRPRARQALFQKYSERGFNFMTLVHPSAIVSPLAVVGTGAQIMAGAVIQAHAKIGADVIINTRAGIDHHSVIGESTHVAPGATICGAVSIGKATMIGAGAIVIQGLKIGDSCLVAAGVTVRQAMPSGTHMLGS